MESAHCGNKTTMASKFLSTRSVLLQLKNFETNTVCQGSTNEAATCEETSDGLGTCVWILRLFSNLFNQIFGLYEDFSK